MKGTVIKLDIEKVLDRVDWDFVDQFSLPKALVQNGEDGLEDTLHPQTSRFIQKFF